MLWLAATVTRTNEHGKSLKQEWCTSLDLRTYNSIMSSHDQVSENDYLMWPISQGHLRMVE